MKLIFAIAVLLLVAPSLAFSQTRSRRPARKSRATRAAPTARPAAAVSPTAVKDERASTTTATGLTYFVTKRGDGRKPKVGETVVVHYTGMLTNGIKFDSSRDRNEPIDFPLGQGRVIKGWDEGIAQLGIGDQAILIIPPQLGYGERGAGNGEIPPNATLIFIVELVDVK